MSRPITSASDDEGRAPQDHGGEPCSPHPPPGDGDSQTSRRTEGPGRLSKFAVQPELRTELAQMTDEEFIEALRSRLPDRSWTLAHLIELDRRGRELTESDAELHTALEESYGRILETLKGAAEALQQQFTVSLEPLQQQLRETVRSMAPQIDIKSMLPNFDRLVSPAFAQPPKVLIDELATPTAFGSALEASDLAPSTWPSAAPYVSATSAEIIEARQQQLEQAKATLSVAEAALDRLTEIRDEARSPRWFDKVMMVAAVVAAVGAVGAVVVSLV